MKHLFLALLLFVLDCGQASSFVIYDYEHNVNTYYGGSLNWGTAEQQDLRATTSDVLGGQRDYGVDAMMVMRGNSTMTAVVLGPFLSHYTQPSNTMGIMPGDLFLSVGEWTPFGDGHRENDNLFTGEQWEYVLSMSDGGYLSLYEVERDRIITTDSYGWLLGSYRSAHAHRYDGNGQVSLGDGLWHIVGDALVFNLSTIYSGMTLADYGLDGIIAAHWTMSCGNDVIEGSSEVPEPASMLLFALGMVSIVVSRRMI